MKVVIAGSRSINSPELLEKAISRCPFASSITEVVSGGAVGVDSLGEAWARSKGLKLTIMLPKWLEYKTKKLPPYLAAMHRNTDMAKYADGLLAVWDGISKGTKHMIEEMRKLEKPVWVVKFGSSGSIEVFWMNCSNFALSTPELERANTEPLEIKTPVQSSSLLKRQDARKIMQTPNGIQYEMYTSEERERHDIDMPKFRGYIVTDSTGHFNRCIPIAEKNIYRIHLKNVFGPLTNWFACTREPACLFDWDSGRTDERVFEVRFGGLAASLGNFNAATELYVIRELSESEISEWISGPFTFSPMTNLENYSKEQLSGFNHLHSVYLEQGRLHNIEGPALADDYSKFYAIEGEIFTEDEEDVWKREIEAMKKRHAKHDSSSAALDAIISNRGKKRASSESTTEPPHKKPELSSDTPVSQSN